jgi:RNA ligase
MKLPDEITSLEQIQQLAMQGFEDWKRYGDVKATRKGDLLLFSYTTEAQYANRWNFFERVSRGLIIHRRSGEIVARPFDKFFHWLSGPKASGHITVVLEKVDGSLGILYREKDEYFITTKGDFFSSQGEWATQFLRAHFDLSDLPNELTLLFEIIYPENRVIVDYGDREDLILLAARNRFSGAYLPFFPDLVELAAHYGFSLPKVYPFNNIDEIMQQTGKVGAEIEGWVIEFSDGQRFKIKGDRYVELHRLREHLTFKNVLAAVAAKSINFLLETAPDEFLVEVMEWVNEIQTTVQNLKERVEAAFVAAPKATRKDFALWVQANHRDISVYLFAMYDDEPIEPLIYKYAFKDRVKQTEEVLEAL